MNTIKNGHFFDLKILLKTLSRLCLNRYHILKISLINFTFNFLFGHYFFICSDAISTLLFISLLIFIFDGYPILFRQERIGKNNTLFHMYKFRTMINNVGDILNLKLKSK